LASFLRTISSANQRVGLLGRWTYTSTIRPTSKPLLRS
jgi:hypothetical protein